MTLQSPKLNTRFFVLFLFFASAATAADTQSAVKSESRDASTGYILTQNFIIGRTARDCFPILGRTDTPKSFELAWQQRNNEYVNAAKTYMNRRLAEAESSEGVAGRNRVASALNAAIAKDGLGAVEDVLTKDDQSAACKKLVGLIEKGAFDFDSRSPMFDELRALVRYMQP